MDPGAEHVVVVAHDDPVFGVDDFALVAFDVQDNTRGIVLLDQRTVALESVASDGQEGTAQGVEMGNGRRFDVDSRFGGGLLFGGPSPPPMRR
jgi:hypothetical protein